MKHLTLPVDPDEYARLRSSAREANLSVVNYLRTLCGLRLRLGERKPTELDEAIALRRAARGEE